MSETLLAPAVPQVLSRTRGVAIGHVASALPDRVVTNEPIAARLGVSSHWITSRTGVEQRRLVTGDEGVTELGARAGRAVIETAGLDPATIDLVLVATFTADDITPNAAPVIAHAVGAVNAGAMDVGAACTAFISALSLAAAQIESHRADVVLVIAAEALSRVTDNDDRRTAALFGDGAGAVLLTATDDGASRIGPVVLGADGSQRDLLFASRESGVIWMQGQDVFRHAVARMAEATLQACERSGVALDDIDLFVYHQANGRILRSVAQRLDLDPGRVVDTVGPYGNVSAATIPIALDVASADGRLHAGSRVLLSAFGAGFTWGGTVIEWGGSA